MFKNILLSGLLCTLLSAESFDNFLQKAIQDSPYLQSSSLNIKVASQNGSMLTRYKNPSLELEYSNFSPDIGSNDNGYRLNYTQPLRLWSVEDDNKELASSMLKRADAKYNQDKANFVKNISLSFTSFAQTKKLLSLGNEELEIAKKIYDISQARYDNGTISRGFMLQAKIDYEMVQIKNESLSLASLQSYYSLLRLSGVNEEIQIDSKYTFIINNTAGNNPYLTLLQSSQNNSLAEAKVNENKISWIDLFAEFEAEPEQDIARFGVNIPLAIFNTKSQENKISTLKANKTKLILSNETTRLQIDINRLKKERISLSKQKLQNEDILETELELLDMFNDGYKIANINLLQLQDIKNKVISTKRNIILINTALNQNAIYTNYNQGSFND